MAQNWKPSAACIGGVGSGLYFSVDELYDWMSGGNSRISYVSRNPIKISCSIYTQPQPYGPFPSFGDPMPGFESAYYSNFDGGWKDHLLAEFTVKLPEGSTLHKQTLCFYLKSYCVYDSAQRNYKRSNVGYARMTRRAYTDATTYSETNIVTWDASITGLAYLPNKETLPHVTQQILFSFGNINYQNVEQYGMGVWLYADGGNYSNATGFFMFCARKSDLVNAFGDLEFDTKNDPNSDDDDNDGDDWDGGDGDHDNHSDIILDPDEPGAGTASSGFLTLYSASNALLKTFADSLYDTTAWAEIKKYFTHPLDWIVSCVMLPFPPEITGSASPVWGDFTWPVTLSIIDQYKTIQCGKMPITEYWGNFMDYAPYTKIMIWLPYIGYRELDTDMVMGHILNLKYIVDCCTGDCTAILSIDVVGIEGPDIPKIVGQYYGNCGVKVPISQISHDALIQASISGLIGAGQVAVQNAGNVVSAAETGDPDAALGIVNSVAKWGGNTAIGVINGLKPEIQHTGVCGMAHGFFSAQKPFIIKTIPIQSLPENFRLQNGYMTNRSGKLGDFDGYVEVESIQLNNVPAYEEELKEIIALLKGGVII